MVFSLLACLVLSIGHLVDLVYSLIVACTFALYIIIQRSLNVFDSFNLLMTQLLIVAILMLPLVFIFSGPIPTETIFYQCIMMIVILFTIIPMFLNNFALKGMLLFNRWNFNLFESNYEFCFGDFLLTKKPFRQCK